MVGSLTCKFIAEYTDERLNIFQCNAVTTKMFEAFIESLP